MGTFGEFFPMLATADLESMLRFYRDLLGFEQSYQFPPEGEPGFVTLRLGVAELGIGAGGVPADVGPGRTSFCIYAHDCDDAVALLRANGVTVTAEPEDQPWGERMARVLDPDGNEVVIMARPSSA